MVARKNFIFLLCLYYFTLMQYKNISNIRVSQNYKKFLSTNSQSTPQTQTNHQQSDTRKSKQLAFLEKLQPRQPINIPHFSQKQKAFTVCHSAIFSQNHQPNDSIFQNPFDLNNQTMLSNQEQKKKKDQVPTFLKIESRKLKKKNSDNEKNSDYQDYQFYEKIKSPSTLLNSQRIYPTKSSLNNFETVKKGSESGNQTFSPIHPKRTFISKIQSSILFVQNKQFPEREKQKDIKSDEKTTIGVSEKNTRVPEFLKKGNLGNKSIKAVESKNLYSSEELFSLKKVSNQIFTLPESPSQKILILQNMKSSAIKNYVSILNNFPKKQSSQFNCGSFAKKSNTPQNIPLKTENYNLQFGRLSSPSSLFSRKKVQPNLTTKKFSLQGFDLVDKIGKGAFGDVYIAREKITGFLCVLKKVSKKKIKELKLQESIIREIKIQSFLKHKHLTCLYGFFNDEDYLYLIMQILPDGSLSRVKKNKKIPQGQVSSYLRQVCEGLKYMHTEQIIHRDLKPQNIFLNQDYLKIGDFGCAIHTHTLRNTLVGCLAYISPEQLKNQSYDHKIDAWSVGILTYELIFGKAPFEQNFAKISKNQMALSHLKLQFPKDSEASELCKDFIKKLLALDPNDRISVDEAVKHPFIIKDLEKDRKKEQQIFGNYQSL